MTYEKDGDFVRAIDSNGTVIGYIKRQRHGTHGHWRGYLHYVPCKDRDNRMIWAGIEENYIYPDRPHVEWKSWTEAPSWFSNVKEFKAYYDRMEEEQKCTPTT